MRKAAQPGGLFSGAPGRAHHSGVKVPYRPGRGNCWPDGKGIPTARRNLKEALRQTAGPGTGLYVVKVHDGHKEFFAEKNLLICPEMGN